MKGIVNTLEKRLYQLLIGRLDGDRIDSQAYQQKIFELVRKGIGGFILFGGERDGIRTFIDQMQSVSEVPLFIASDIERGAGQQIKGCTPFPCQMGIRAAINKDRGEEIRILRDAIKAIAQEAIDVGINMPLIPVLDVNQDPDNPIICTRAFSDNARDVSWFGSEYIRVLEDSGLISCAKHFPGHGDTQIDSHLALPVISKSYERLMEKDVAPFIEAVGVGVSSVMVGHLMVPALDATPASISRRVIQDLLREEIGFEGLILTDALNMSALSNIDNVPARCLNAGADLLLHPADPDLTVEDLLSAVRSKAVSEGCIDAAIGRILETKSWLRYMDRREVDYGNHDALSKEITDRSITLVKDKPGILPIPDGSNVQIVFAGEERFYERSLWRGHFKNAHIITKGNETFRSQGLTKEDEIIPPYPPLEKGGKGGFEEFSGESPPPQIEKAGGGKGDGEKGFPDGITIIALFTEIAAWKGSSGIDEEARKEIRGLIEKARGSVVISFGSPYVLRHFKKADILIAAYEATPQAQGAVVRCLKGEMEFKGQLPVNVRLSC